MGRNDEYSRDAYYEESWMSDDSDEFENEIDGEDWAQLYSDDIWGIWCIIREYFHDNYLVMPRNCTFTAFEDFVVYPKAFFSNKAPTPHSVEVWRRISRVSFIRDRVSFENFYTWFDIYMK
jgi:hypothetical protein